MNTIEAAVIIPLFTVIFVMMIQLNISLHDSVIINSAETKFCMAEELADTSVEMYEEYVRNKSMDRDEYVLSYEKGERYIKTENAQIMINNPCDFLRKAKAVINTGGQIE